MPWYIALFVSAFAAASLLPGSPDAVLVGAIINGNDAFLCITVATIGSYLGAALNYVLGRGVHSIVSLQRWTPTEAKVQWASDKLRRYGQLVLILSWLPIIGDPMTFCAGYLRMKFATFSLWVVVGRIIRFATLAGVTLWFS